MSTRPEAKQPILYVVRCTFADGSEQVAERWLTWLQERHLAEVLAAGALSAEIYRIEATDAQYEIHYRFANREAFSHYEQYEAPRLRADGLNRFPLSLGLQYSRQVGRLLKTN